MSQHTLPLKALKDQYLISIRFFFVMWRKIGKSLLPMVWDMIITLYTTTQRTQFFSLTILFSRVSFEGTLPTDAGILKHFSRIFTRFTYLSHNFHFFYFHKSVTYTAFAFSPLASPSFRVQSLLFLAKP